jgi:hypothetical protein
MVDFSIGLIFAQYIMIHNFTERLFNYPEKGITYDYVWIYKRS